MLTSGEVPTVLKRVHLKKISFKKRKHHGSQTLPSLHRTLAFPAALAEKIQLTAQVNTLALH
jgi:hypothetical protein